jgi:phosphatidylglycerophosphatase A
MTTTDTRRDMPGQAPTAAPADSAAGAAASPVPPLAPVRASVRFLLKHPAHWLALGLGSGLSPRAPGTVGTLWAWVAFLALDPWLSDRQWAAVIALSALVGWWACTVTARHLGTVDPSAVVWDEVVAFWLILWIWMPASLWQQALAFGVFRFFDAAKPGPVGWADARFKAVRRSSGEMPRIGWAQGFGILFDDVVAALCTLLVLAVLREIGLPAGAA